MIHSPIGSPVGSPVGSPLAHPLFGGWTPAKLFSGGVAGAWYEPSQTTCYTDVAMTTLAEVGDTVAAVADLSGNGNHATQANAANQPKLQQDGNGKYYLSFDGVDDYLRVTASAVSQPMTHFAVASASGAMQNIFNGVDGGSPGAYVQHLAVDGAPKFIASAGVVINAPFDANTNLWTVIFNGASSVLRKNGSVVASGDCGTNQWSGTTLGANRISGNMLDGPVYAYLAVNSLVSDMQVVESYFARKTGAAL